MSKEGTFLVHTHTEIMDMSRLVLSEYHQDPGGLAARLLEVVHDDIVPATREGVKGGNKVFGAAILRKDDLSVVVAATNNEVKSPLFHGEVVAINTFFELPASTRPRAEDCIFLATHEPCCLCLSSIAWAKVRRHGHL